MTITTPPAGTTPPEPTAEVATPRRGGRSWRATFLGADTEGRATNTSWASIIAGVVVATSVLITFSLIGAALGLGITDPTSDQPFAGVGVGLAIWGVLTLVISLAAGGFVAGVLAVKAGFLHGLAVWATTTIALTVALAFGIGGAVGAAGSLLGSLGSAVGSGAATVADVAGDTVGAVTDGIAEQIDIDPDQLGDDIEQVLADTGVEELQPEYLRAQLDEAQSDVADAAQELVVDPENYEQILGDLTSSLQERAETIGDAVDRDAIANAVAENTELTDEEAEQAVDNAYEAIEAAVTEAQQALEQAQETLDEAVAEAERIIAETRQNLDEASDAAAQAAVWGFIALLLGAAITAFAGLWGSRLVVGRDEAGRPTTP